MADDAATQGVARRAHWSVFIGLAGTIVVLDQLTKAWLQSNFAPGQVVEIVGDWVRLVFGQNSGALFGLFRDQALLFALASLGVVVLIVVYHGRATRSLYLSMALGFLLGGAIGNFVDRIRLGYVVDFVDVGIGNLRFYTFNIADAGISTAIVLLLAVAVVPSVARIVDARFDG